MVIVGLDVAIGKDETVIGVCRSQGLIRLIAANANCGKSVFFDCKPGFDFSKIEIGSNAKISKTNLSEYDGIS